MQGARLVPSSGSQFFQAAVQDHSPVEAFDALDRHGCPELALDIQAVECPRAAAL